MERVRLKVENGYLLEAPLYKSHKRGKNWLAVIELDPKSPGGLKRRFATPGRGDYLYSVEELQIGDAVEFGADYYTTGGRRVPGRWYGVVTDIKHNYVEVLGPFDSPREAVTYSEDLKREFVGVSKQDLLKEIYSELERMNIEQLQDILNYIRSKSESFVRSRCRRVLDALIG